MKSLLISTHEQEKLIQDETERRRTLRLLQTRQIEKERAAQLRQTVANEKKKQTFLLINQLKNEWTQEKVDQHENLEYQFRENLMEMGKGHKEAADQPDYEQEWLEKALDNDARASERGQQAIEKLHIDMMQNENQRNLHILHRKAALELEKVRAQRIAKLPLLEDPLRDLQTNPTTIVTVHDPYNFSTSRYHLEERLVTKEDDQGDAAQDAIVEGERIAAFVADKERLWNEQQEKARVRGDNALKREVLDNAYDNVLDELGKLERQDRDRRQKEIQTLPKSIFIPPWRREEEREEKQRQMETAFEQAYQDNHRKQPIPIVLMNEDESLEEDGANDRTLVAESQGEEQEQVKSTVEYRFATVTPSVNPMTIVEEMHDDDEATLADPTLMTLQTPLLEQPIVRQQQQQNMNRLLEKIDRQRKAAQNRVEQQTAIVTPTMKTPAKLIVSPGYIQSGTSMDSSLTQQDEQETSSANTTTTAEIETRRVQLESRKQALEEQIRLLSGRANLLPQNSTSSDLSIESLLKNLRANSNPTSVTSTSPSIYAGKEHDDEHELFAQAVQAIITSDESQLQTSSSGIAIEDEEKTQETISEDLNRGKFSLEKYESHSSEDRDQSLEELISRLVANQKPSQLRSEPMPVNNGALIIDDLVDDVLSSISSLSAHTTHEEHRSPSPEIAQLLLLNRNVDQSQEFHVSTNEQKSFLEEKRMIEQELELIRREREHLLQEHEQYRQQTTTPSSAAKQQVIPAQLWSQIQPPPPPSLLRAKINILGPNEVHELSTIQEVDTPVSSRNTSFFHHRSPLKSSLDLQQLERISSADSSSSSSSIHNEHPSSQPPPSIANIPQQLVAQTGLERDDSGISLIDGPRSSATSRTTLAGGHGGGGGKSSSSGIQSLLTNRQPRVRTITNETTTTNTSTSANNLPAVITTPRSNTESDDQSISSVSKKWRDILANECLPQLPPPSLLFNYFSKESEVQLTNSLGFGPSKIEEILSPATAHPTDLVSNQNQEQYLRSQYDNEQCDLMSLIKVHEYLTKQQHPSAANPTPTVEQFISTSTPPPHHQSYSTLTSVTYRSSLAKQAPTTGSGAAPASTPSHTSFSSTDNPTHSHEHEEHERRNSIVSDIHHLTRSPNTFETSSTSHSSMNSHQHQDTLSYLIEQNQRAMQRLIANPLTESSTFYSSASMRAPDYESGQLTRTTISTEKMQHKTTLIETGSLSTVDFPSALLHAEDQQPPVDSKLDSDEHGILDEPSLTLLSNSYRSLTTTTGPHLPTILAQSSSHKQQKKKQCSSPISTSGDKTSACSTPSLSPIKNESFKPIENPIRDETSTPTFSQKQHSNRCSLEIRSSSSTTNSSASKASNKQKHSSDGSSLLSFERHELSAHNATVLSTTDHPSPASLPIEGRNADGSSFLPVGKQVPGELEKPSSSSSSSSSSTDQSDDRQTEGVEFFIDGEEKNGNPSQTPQFPSLQSAFQTRRADLIASSEKRVQEIKSKDFTKLPSSSSLPTSSRLRTAQAHSATPAEFVETEPEDRKVRVRESKERSKRLYDQLAEVQQKKKFHQSKQQAQAYRARMNAFQTTLNQKKTSQKKQQ